MKKADLRDALIRCTRWARALERGIEQLLEADELGEHDAAMEHLKRLMERR